MLEVIRTLAKYGPITIEARNRQWKVGCMVTLPTGAMRSYVSVYGETLYVTLQKLIPLAAEREKELWVEFRAPKQQAFNYGTGDGGEGHP